MAEIEIAGPIPMATPRRFLAHHGCVTGGDQDDLDDGEDCYPYYLGGKGDPLESCGGVLQLLVIMS